MLSKWWNGMESLLSLSAVNFPIYYQSIWFSRKRREISNCYNNYSGLGLNSHKKEKSYYILPYIFRCMSFVLLDTYKLTFTHNVVDRGRALLSTPLFLRPSDEALRFTDTARHQYQV